MAASDVTVKNSPEGDKDKKEGAARSLLVLGIIIIISGWTGLKYYVSDYVFSALFKDYNENLILFLLSCIIPFALYVALFWIFGESKENQNLRENVSLTLLLLLSLAGLYRIFKYIYVDVDFVKNLKEFTSFFYKPYLYIVASSTIVFLSWLAFFMRCQQRTLYGIIEMFFGMATTILSSFPIVDIFYDNPIEDVVSYSMMQLFFQIVGGIYIVVRGLDNIDNGIYRESNARSVIKARAIREKMFGRRR